MKRPGGALVLALCLLQAPAAAGDQGAQRVLVLHSERLELPGSIGVDTGIRSTLGAAVSRPTEIYSESLDVARFPGERHFQAYRSLLRGRYIDRTPDVIITIGEPAIDFIIQHRDALFPGAAVVASRVGASIQSLDAAPPWITGVVVRSQMRTTFELMLKLHPNTRRVVIVAGASPTDRYQAQRAQRELREVSPTVEVIDLGESTMAGILQAVASQPSGTIIFYLHILRDGGGQLFVPRDALARIAKVANAPMYGRYDTFVGYGIVGGHVYGFQAHGAQLAEVALRILGGERAQNIGPIEAAADVYMFDWRQLRRWGIAERLLPAGSVVRFRDPSMWQRYRWHIVVAIGLLVLQSALIVGLLVNRLLRRRAERETQRQREELAHVLRVTTLGELTASLAHEISQPLSAILANAVAARRSLDAARPVAPVREALDDIADDAKRATRIIGRLRALFRKEHQERVAVDLNALIEEVVGLLRAEMERRRIVMRVAQAKALPPALGDPIQLQQVLMNLVVNACEAIDTTEVGRRAILIEATQPDRGHLAIEIRDSGVGVKESELERIFEHFVSSKPQGLGMGLAISRSIVQAHGGRIWATANADIGLTMHVELPVCGEPVATRRARELVLRGENPT